MQTSKKVKYWSLIGGVLTIVGLLTLASFFFSQEEVGATTEGTPVAGSITVGGVTGTAAATTGFRHTTVGENLFLLVRVDGGDGTIGGDGTPFYTPGVRLRMQVASFPGGPVLFPAGAQIDYIDFGVFPIGNHVIELAPGVAAAGCAAPVAVGAGVSAATKRICPEIAPPWWRFWAQTESLVLNEADDSNYERPMYAVTIESYLYEE